MQKSQKIGYTQYTDYNNFNFNSNIPKPGLLGVDAEPPSNPTLNYIGVALAIVSGIFYLFIQTESNGDNSEDRRDLIGQDGADNINSEVTIANVFTDRPVQQTFLDRLGPGQKRALGTLLACSSGILYGITFTPALYVKDNYKNASQNQLDYVFSLYTGIYCTSIVYFAIYCLIKKNKPKVYSNIILPALVSGTIIFIYLFMILAKKY
jgi:hypothetical protein